MRHSCRFANLQNYKFANLKSRAKYSDGATAKYSECSVPFITMKGGQVVSGRPTACALSRSVTLPGLGFVVVNR